MKKVKKEIWREKVEKENKKRGDPHPRIKKSKKEIIREKRDIKDLQEGKVQEIKKFFTERVNEGSHQPNKQLKSKVELMKEKFEVDVTEK